MRDESYRVRCNDDDELFGLGLSFEEVDEVSLRPRMKRELCFIKEDKAIRADRIEFFGQAYKGDFAGAEPSFRIIAVFLLDEIRDVLRRTSAVGCLKTNEVSELVVAEYLAESVFHEGGGGYEFPVIDVARRHAQSAGVGPHVHRRREPKRVQDVAFRSRLGIPSIGIFGVRDSPGVCLVSDFRIGIGIDSCIFPRCGKIKTEGVSVFDAVQASEERGFSTPVWTHKIIDTRLGGNVEIKSFDSHEIPDKNLADRHRSKPPQFASSMQFELAFNL